MKLRRIVRVAGTVVLVAGALTVAWGLVTWQWGDPVTGFYTRWKQRDLAHSYAHVAQQFAIPDGTGQHASDPMLAIRAAAKRLRTAAHEGQAIGRIQVPRLDLNMVLVNGTDHDSLKTGPGRDARTYMPGQGELVYVAGHRTTYGAPFARIDRLAAGDRIVLRMPYVTAVYRVTSHVIVPADDLSRLASHGREVVALQACHPRFSARERYIVYARPVSFTPVQAETASAAASVRTSSLD